MWLLQKTPPHDCLAVSTYHIYHYHYVLRWGIHLYVVISCAQPPPPAVEATTINWKWNGVFFRYLSAVLGLLLSSLSSFQHHHPPSSWRRLWWWRCSTSNKTLSPNQRSMKWLLIWFIFNYGSFIRWLIDGQKWWWRVHHGALPKRKLSDQLIWNLLW